MPLPINLPTTLPMVLARPLVNNAARMFSLPAKLVPFTAHKAVLDHVLHTLFAEALADGDFEFLEGYWLELEVPQESPPAIETCAAFTWL